MWYFNGAGKLDLAVGNYNESTISVLLGDGKGASPPLSIMATIEHRFQLGNTAGADATAQDLNPAFDFTQTP